MAVWVRSFRITTVNDVSHNPSNLRFHQTVDLALNIVYQQF